MAAGGNDTNEAIRTTSAVASTERFTGTNWGIILLPDQRFAARSHLSS
jgi:hypothetical protein